MGERPVEKEKLISELQSLQTRITEIRSLLQSDGDAETGDLSQNKDPLLLAFESAVAASRAKSQFLANMSHEIRTPLNAIVGVADLFQETNLSSPQQDYLSTIKTSTKTLLTLINGFLDLARIEAGKIELESTPFDWRSCVEDVISLLRESAIKKGIELVLSLDHGCPSSVIGDAGRLQQILLNLVGNAIKFTERGDVTVTAYSTMLPNGKLRIKFTVADSGIGIDAETIPEIFNAFSQGIRYSHHQGSGLGLTITKSLVELLGGTISVKSAKGVGSKFSFTLDFMADKIHRDQSSQIDITERRFLIIDDNKHSSAAIARLLQSWGGQTVEINDAQQALALLESPKQTLFDCIFVDHRLHEINGVKMIKKIRELKCYAETPVVLLLYSAVSGASASWLTLPNEYVCLSKPLITSQIIEVLQSVFQPNDLRTMPLGKVKATESNTKKHDILIVEDNVVNQKVMQAMVTKLGYSCDLAEHGERALEMCKEKSYDAILMDCQMPVLNGYETTRAIRENEPSSEHIPILAITAEAMKGDRERCYAAGMDDYLCKPITLNDLRLKLNQLFGENKK